jgi:hypothetical protein
VTSAVEKDDSKITDEGVVGKGGKSSGSKKLRQMEQSMDFHLVGETTWAMLGHEKLMKRLNLFVDYKVKESCFGV